VVVLTPGTLTRHMHERLEGELRRRLGEGGEGSSSSSPSPLSAKRSPRVAALGLDLDASLIDRARAALPPSGSHLRFEACDLTDESR
jgi:hypothetical protein